MYHRSPLPRYVETPHVAGYPVLSDPYTFKVPIQTPGSNRSMLPPQVSYLSFAPPEVTRLTLNNLVDQLQPSDLGSLFVYGFQWHL